MVWYQPAYERRWARLGARAVLPYAGGPDGPDTRRRWKTTVHMEAATPILVASTNVVAMGWGHSDVWPFYLVTAWFGRLRGATEISLSGCFRQAYGGEPPPTGRACDHAGRRWALHRWGRDRPTPGAVAVPARDLPVGGARGADALFPGSGWMRTTGPWPALPVPRKRRLEVVGTHQAR